MNTPVFLTFKEVETLHDKLIKAYGGIMGIRDKGLIESALASAQNTFAYGGGDLFDVAVAYAFHLAEAQAFLDGNKRVAIGATIYFLKGHDITQVPSDEILYNAMIAIANHQMDKAQLSALFREAANSAL